MKMEDEETKDILQQRVARDRRELFLLHNRGKLNLKSGLNQDFWF